MAARFLIQCHCQPHSIQDESKSTKPAQIVGILKKSKYSAEPHDPEHGVVPDENIASDLSVPADSVLCKAIMVTYIAIYLLSLLFLFIAGGFLMSKEQVGAGVSLLVLAALGHVATSAAVWKWSSQNVKANEPSDYSPLARAVLQLFHAWTFFEFVYSWKARTWLSGFMLIALVQTSLVFIPAAFVLNYTMLHDSATSQAFLITTEIFVMFCAVVTLSIFRQKVACIPLSVISMDLLGFHLQCRLIHARANTAHQHQRQARTRGGWGCSGCVRSCRA
jgi:hypothetical protein